MRDIVVYVGIMFLPDRNALCQRAFSLIESIKDLGNTPVAVGFSNELPAGEIVEKQYYGIQCFEVGYPKSGKEWVKSLYDTKCFVEIFEKLGPSKIKSVILADYRFLATIKMHRYCIKKGIHFVCDIMDWFSYSDKKNLSEVVKIWDTWAKIYLAYPFIKRKICISSAFHDMYKSKGKSVLIPGTIIASDKKWRNCGNDRLSEAVTLAFAGVTGKRCRKERVDWVIRAVCEINQEEGKNINFYIAGVDKNAFYEENTELLALKEDANIHFLGRITHEACLELIKKSDFTIVPRSLCRLNQYGFSTKISESLACGVPVLLTHTSDVKKYIKDGKNGFVCEPEYASLKEMIRNATGLSRQSILEMKKNSKENNPLIYQNYTKKLEEVL